LCFVTTLSCTLNVTKSLTTEWIQHVYNDVPSNNMAYVLATFEMIVSVATVSQLPRAGS